MMVQSGGVRQESGSVDEMGSRRFTFKTEWGSFPAESLFRRVLAGASTGKVDPTELQVPVMERTAASRSVLGAAMSGAR